MTRRPLRNIGILAHIDAGKTTLTENLLYATGAIRYPGAVEHGSTVTDWQLQEQERGITIASAAISCRWRDVDVTIVDTPGHVDFTMEVERSLRVLDGAILVISGPDGVQAQTETVWSQAYARRVPVIALINKLDRPGFDDASLLAEMRERLGIEPVPLYVPLVTPEELVLIDVLAEELIAWPLASLVRRQRTVPERRPLDAGARALREAAFERLVNAVASFDDAFAEEVLRGAVPCREATLRALRAAMAGQACLPVLYGVARFGVGVSQVADAIVDLLPAPDEVSGPPTYDLGSGLRSAPAPALDPNVTAAFVYKTEIRARGERLVFVRVFAGTIAAGRSLMRLAAGRTCRPTEIVRIMGGDTEPVECLETGMIGGLTWPRDTEAPVTGETLGDEGLGVTFERIDAPQPVISITLEADDAAGHDVMLALVGEYCADDPSLVLSLAPDSGLTTLSGMGELHLALIAERVARELGRPIRTGVPAAKQRQIIQSPGRARVERTDAWTGRGRVLVEVAVRPVPGGLGELVRYEVTRPRRPDWREALEAGLRAGIGADGSGSISVVGVEIAVIGLEAAGADIAPVVFRDAALAAVTEALISAAIVDAEPWVALSIVVPEMAVGRLVGDLARRGARIRGTESRGVAQVIAAEAPLARVIGFATDLRSMTAGRGVFTMEPMGYEALSGR